MDKKFVQVGNLWLNVDLIVKIIDREYEGIDIWMLDNDEINDTFITLTSDDRLAFLNYLKKVSHIAC